MTREEAAKCADNMTYRDAINNLMKAKSIPYRKATFIKVNDLIKALEREPCADAVSRMAINNLRKYNLIGGISTVSLIDINKLPPVNPQEPKTEKVIKMRDATPEERESIYKYIKSISKPTGVAFWDLEQEPKTGHWEWQTEDIYRCSECGEDIHVKEVLNVPQYEWCPMCGAKMAESEDEK